MLERLLCFLRRRHEYRFRSENGLAFLECEHCGYRSSGWETGPRPTPTHSPQPLRLLLGDPAESATVVSLPRPDAGSARGHELAEASGEFRLLFDA